MKLKHLFIALTAMLWSFSLTANEQVNVETLDELQAALAGDNSSVVITETIVIPVGETVELDLNGKTISAADKNVIKNNGATLTIKNGKIERTGTVAGYAVNVVSGTLEVEDVTIVGGLYTSGTSLVATNTNISQASASRHAIYAYNCAVTINSGTYHNDNAGNAAVFAYGSSVVTINNGTFSIDNGKQTFGWTSCLLDANAGGKYVINGGEFKGHFRVQANSSMEINGGTFENTHGEAYAINGSVAVKGGTFTDDAAKTFAGKYLAENFKLGEDGKVVSTTPTLPVAAKIGDTPYETIQAAINAAQDGQTVEIYAGEFGAINISNKNITLQGTVGENGELLTTIKGGNPAITGHSFNGTIKDIKIVDAFKVMYAEPAGNVTVDNVSVIGATYGLHLVAYATGLTWTIQNSYMDLSWANSFGVYGGGDAAIVITGNKFESTSPYYPDYGALSVNTFLPNVTVTENIFGANAKIYIDNSVTDLSKVNISNNYHADGIENAFADDADGVKADINSYYTEVKEDGTLSGLVTVVRGLSGAGTEADPFLINNVDDLILFRNSVNAGETTYNAKGVYVALGANIDLAGQDWSVNIGDDCANTFDGIFDGKGLTIKNLTSEETAQKADGYICTGLFGAIGGNAVVKNFTIENVTINTGDFTGNNVAAVVGFAYNAKGSIENVKVTGNININAKNAVSVGAILGYDYYCPELVVKNCEVKGNSGSAIVGLSYVGGAVGYASNKIQLLGNSVENVNITANNAAAGGVAGIMLAGGSAANNTVKNVNLASNHVNWNDAVGVVVGSITTGKVTIANTTIENVNTDAVVGAIHANKPITPVTKVEACIDNDYYTTFEGAYQAAQEGATITLLAPVVIADGETLTLDKNVAINNTAKFDGALSISAGTYDADVTEFCAGGFICQNNGDGTYGVKADLNYIAELVIDDAEGKVLAEHAGKTVGTLTYKRELSMANVWQPLYVPFGIQLSEELLADFDIAYFNAVMGYDDNDDQVTDRTIIEVIKIEDANAALKANYPLLIRAKSAEKTAFELTMEKVIMGRAEEHAVICESVSHTYEIKGTYTEYTSIEDNQRVLGLDEDGKAAWGTLAEGYSLKPYRLILTINSRDDADLPFVGAIRMRVVGEEDEDGATAIYDVEVEEQGADRIFDLQGRRVLEPQKGNLYIINGKKVVIK